MTGTTAYDRTLPAGLRSRFVDNGNGLTMHVLEAGDEGPQRPRLLLLHGFPELAWSWRRIAPALADAGYHVIAPDQRGYGRTTGGDTAYDSDLGRTRIFNLVRDTLGLLTALGHSHVDAVVGHDFGAILAPWCALLRPDVFRSLVVMSAPFAGPPRIPRPGSSPDADVHAELAALDPPRKHYQWYYSTPEADADMRHCAQGIHDFLRAYFHVKSADWPGNAPHPLTAWNARELAKLPGYYVMPLHQDMAQTVAADMPDAAHIAANVWLPDDELAVYSAEFARTGFQAALNWYRCRTSGLFDAEMQIFDGCQVSVPTCFIAGAADWGSRQTPGALEAMRTRACARMLGCHLVDGAGHWVQQEQPDAVIALVLEFLRQAVRG
jgi:pimeloyl-ACP methyl ester carboxylesterase